MDNSQIRANRGSRRNKKTNKKYAWKILNEQDTTSDQDSDGTTGSVDAGRRVRDSSECSSLNADKKFLEFEDKPNNNNEIITIEETYEESPPQESKTKKKRTRHKSKSNYIHTNNDTKNSVLNSLLVASLLIVSGLASGHYIASHSGSTCFNHHLPTNLLNRYVSRTIEMYESLLSDNSELRDRIRQLEYSIQNNENINTQELQQYEKEILQELIQFFDNKIDTVMNIVNSTEPKNVLNEIDDINVKTTSSTDYADQEREFEQMIEDGKALQHRLKRKKSIKDENIAKSDEKEKNNQEVATMKNEKTFCNDKERVIETLADADYAIADCETVDPETESEKISTKKPSSKSGYVYNIRKLFEPNVNENQSSTDQISTKSTDIQNQVTKSRLKDKIKDEEIKQQTDIQENVIQLENDKNMDLILDNEIKKYESFENLLEDSKAEIRESKRKVKNRSMENNGRARRKPKHDRSDKPNLVVDDEL